MRRMNPAIWHHLCSRIKPEVWRYAQTKRSTHPEKFVLCGILFGEKSHVMKRQRHKFAFGVNYSLHRRINEYKHLSSYMNGQRNVVQTHIHPNNLENSSLLLKGILKGCAEQNALGSLAARGVPYAAIQKIYILSLEQEFLQRLDEKMLFFGSQQTYLESMHDTYHDLNKKHENTFLPCSACLRYLNFIGQCVKGYANNHKSHNDENIVEVFTMQNMNKASAQYLQFPPNIRAPV